MNIPIHRVNARGAVERLGHWRHTERVLELERTGFPFFGSGEHRLDSELPWVFWEMCPSGYLGRKLARRRPDLGLASDPLRWSAEDCLRVLTTAGADVPGNLLIGEKSVEQFYAWRFDVRDVATHLDEIVSEQRTDTEPSCLGGERPKSVVYDADGAGFLVKFSPPINSQTGQLWSDLLRMEAHASRTLGESLRLGSVAAQLFNVEGRTVLDIDRFDRLAQRGRRGAVTLYWLAAALYDPQLSAPEVMRRLADDGHVDVASVRACEVAHAFSAAIGNDDAHLGNYALLFDDDGRATLAPLYDVLPMRLAPRNDELPDAYLQPTLLNESMRPAVEHLSALAEGDADISRDFIGRWRRLVGL